MREAGFDAYVAWGRWTNGAVNARLFGIINTTQQLNANSGIHYLVGVPTQSMPTSGEATYSLLGATLATGKEVAPLNVTGSAAVVFAPNLGTRIGLDLRLASATGDQEYRLTTTGGLGNARLSELRLTTPNRFDATVGLSTNGVDSACNNGACTATVTGGFFGPDAQRLGVSYAILRNRSVRIEGVATFKKN